MDQLRVYAKILIVLLTLSQVLGNPMFFWNQQEPDCSQQNNNDNSYQNYQQNSYQSYQAPSYQQPSSYQDPSYQGGAYQGPSYQETLQAMIADTLRALCDIVQSTVQASKQEIATLARMILRKSSSQTNCDSDDAPEEEYNVQPTVGNPEEPQGVTTVGVETSTLKSALLVQNHNASTANLSIDVSNSTSLDSSSLKSGLNATLPSNSTTKSVTSTTEKMNSETPKGTVLPLQNSNKTVPEGTTITS